MSLLLNVFDTNSKITVLWEIMLKFILHFRVLLGTVVCMHEFQHLIFWFDFRFS